MWALVSDLPIELEDQYQRLRLKIDKLFQILFLIQWPGVVLLAWTVSPLSWDGRESYIHAHVWMAFILGGCLSILPLYCVKRRPGSVANGYVMTSCQMLYSVLIIHVCNGRIESHFHVFGSLAILASYRNPRIIVLASLITVVDHLMRGFYLPASIYSVANSSVLRAFEHGAWVVFEDVFLIHSILISKSEMSEIARGQDALKRTLAGVEEVVQERTRQLMEAQKTLLEQKENLINAKRLSSLGEMASGIAHEINNPMAIILSLTLLMKKKLARKEAMDSGFLETCLQDIEKTVERVTNIVRGMRNLSRDALLETPIPCKLQDIISDVLVVCEEKFRSERIAFSIEDGRKNPEESWNLCRTQLSQILLNLISNAKDAATSSEEPWIILRIEEEKMGSLQVRVLDSGPGIPCEIRDKIFHPFFTTKEIGKGTGLGLSISKGLMQKMGGDLTLDEGAQTCFVISLPVKFRECT